MTFGASEKKRKTCLSLSSVVYTLVYLYDENGFPMGLKYRTNAYAANEYDYFFFEKNLQGDIIAVYDESGTKIGGYIYDAWGVCTTSVTSGNTTLENSIVQSYNPFRYRGYYCDTQSGWYYLQSRYYNPYWGRFVNADGAFYNNLFGFNLFAYCNNNPVRFIDPYGESATEALKWWTSIGLPVASTEPTIVGEIIYIGGYVILAGAVAVESALATKQLVDSIQSAKSIKNSVYSKPRLSEKNPFPNSEDVDIDMDHIMENHHPSGGKGPNKDKFPGWMTAPFIEELVRKGYDYAVQNYPNTVIKIQESRYYFEGLVDGQKIRIWYDYAENLIKTAFPK
ncbi:MAG: RHS repeat-associated core domain-containing protein [Clostridia bacterium]|nr:RHS repeat-associated core domain-containing protein [Clostridia bacterium]